MVLDYTVEPKDNLYYKFSFWKIFSSVNGNEKKDGLHIPVMVIWSKWHLLIGKYVKGALFDFGIVTNYKQ